MKSYPKMLLILVVLGILLIGCGKFTLTDDDGEKTTIDVSDAKDGKISINSDGKDGEDSMQFESDGEGGTTVTDGDGKEVLKANSGEGTELPDGFPKDFPFPDGVDFTSTSETSLDNAVMYGISFTYSDDPDSAYDAIKDFAKSKGFEIEGDSKMKNEDGMLYTFAASNDEGEAIFMYLGAPEEETMLNYTVSSN